MWPPYNWRNGITGEWYLQVWWKFPFELLLEKRRRRRLGDTVTTGHLLWTWPFHASSFSCFNYWATGVLQFLDKTYILHQVKISKCKKQDDFLLAYVMSCLSFLPPSVPTALTSPSNDSFSCNMADSSGFRNAHLDQNFQAHWAAKWLVRPATLFLLTFSKDSPKKWLGDSDNFQYCGRYLCHLNGPKKRV